MDTDKQVILKVEGIIESLRKAKLLSDVSGIKMLKGYKDCYRIRIGNYRLGLQLDDKVVWLARLMDRKEIYRYFP